MRRTNRHRRWLRQVGAGGTALILASAAFVHSARASPLPAHIQGVQAEIMVPAARSFAEQAQQLAQQLSGGCTAPARAALNRTTLAWETFSAVAIGPILERRSQRRIDFRPTRPPMINEAILRVDRLRHDPAYAGATQLLDYIGTPAKGLPALAWLLANDEAAKHEPTCAYVRLLAAEVAQEASALAAAFTARAATLPAEAPAKVALEELLNQWIGGIERLRWAEMEKPLRAQATSATSATKGVANPAAKSALVIRRNSADAARWQAQWRGLRRYALGDGASLQTLLRADETPARGALASQLEQACRNVDQSMRQLDPAQAASVLRATRALAELKALAENEIATALDVRMGFSDADGD